MQHVMFWWQTDHFIYKLFVRDISIQWMLLIWPVLHQVHILQEVQDFLSLLWFRYIRPDLENQDLQQDLGDPEHTNTCSQSDLWPQYIWANQSSREVEEAGLLTGIPSKPGKPGTPTLPWNKEQVWIWTKVLFPYRVCESCDWSSVTSECPPSCLQVIMKSQRTNRTVVFTTEPCLFTESPFSPAAPIGPSSPLWPFSPGGPWGPGKPGGPWGPCRPRGPGGPCRTQIKE